MDTNEEITQKKLAATRKERFTEIRTGNLTHLKDAVLARTNRVNQMETFNKLNLRTSNKSNKDKPNNIIYLILHLCRCIFV